MAPKTICGHRLLPALTGHRLSAVFLTLFLVGLRRGELLGLRWQDVDMKAQVLHIRQTIVRVKDYATGHTQLVVQEPKTASSRHTIPLPEACLTACDNIAPGRQPRGSHMVQAILTTP